MGASKATKCCTARNIGEECSWAQSLKRLPERSTKRTHLLASVSAVTPPHHAASRQRTRAGPARTGPVGEGPWHRRLGPAGLGGDVELGGGAAAGRRIDAPDTCLRHGDELRGGAALRDGPRGGPAAESAPRGACPSVTWPSRAGTTCGGGADRARVETDD